MGKHAAFAGQPVMMIHIQITFMFRPQIAYPGHFIWVFAQMGLHPRVGKLLSEQADRGQQFR